jgi:methanobactin biosynthesis MbnP-like protein
MKPFKLLIISVLYCNILASQNINDLTITIQPLLNSHNLILEKENTESTIINKFKFYLTNFSFTKNDELIWKEKDSYHLIDVSNPSTLNLKFEIPPNIEFDQIHFSLGTDSLINISGVMGGDLDPTKGMYWAWNSGYINFKLEGKSKNIPFEFHLGGYSPSTVQQVKLKIDKQKNTIIYFDIANFLNQIDLEKEHKLMSPGKEAQRLSKIAGSLFYINE